MKPFALAFAIVLTTLSLAALASDPPPAAPATATATTTATPAKTTSTPASTSTVAPALTAAPADSLAAAAQRTAAARSKKKARISINNDNLAKSGGHITTSSGGGMPLPAIPPPQADQNADAAAQRKAYADQLAEKEKKKAEDARKQRLERAASAMDGNALDADDDPALVEHRMAVAAQTSTDAQPPQTTTNAKPPQTTTAKPPQ
jgi:hypothetical protein